MLKRVIFLFFLFYFLNLIQTSFLVHFDIWGKVANLVFLAVIFLNLFTSERQELGLISALIGGFYLDIFSQSSKEFFGFYTLILVILALFIRFVIKKYVQIPVIQKF